MVPVCAGSLLTAWHTRLRVIALADVSEYACSTVVPLSKEKKGLCSYLRISLLFHLMPRLTYTSI
jgi:hypothetical protein